MPTEKEEKIRKVEQVFETNLYEKTGDVMLSGIPSERFVYLTFTASIISLLLTIASLFIANSFFKTINLKTLKSLMTEQKPISDANLKNFDSTNFILCMVFLYVVSFFAIYSIITLIIIFIVRLQDNRAYINFWKFAIAKNSQVLKTTLSFVIYRMLLTIYIQNYQPLFHLSVLDFNSKGEVLNGSLKEALNDENDDIGPDSFKTTMSIFLTIHIKKYVNSLIILLLVYLIKELILQFINYKIHYHYYKGRVLENEKMVRHLKKLNKSISGRVNPDLAKWSSLIYRSLNRHGGGLTVIDFVHYFGAEGQQIFTLFDVNADETISEDEFTTRYISIFNERKELQQALDGNTKEMKKLDMVLSVILMPLALIFIVSTIMNLTTASTFTSMFGTMLSLSFAFGPVISDILWSLIFIFLVRPYDIGDKITIDGVHYTVGEMGLLYSTLFNDSKYHSISNAELRNKKIINLRRSNFITVTIRKTMKYSSSINKMNLLQEKIKTFLQENENMYGEKFSITDYNLKNDIFEFSVRIRLNCPYQEIVSAKKRKDMVAVFLHQCLVEMGFEYV
ncbi:Mechanosensitive ion channel protein 10 [Dictyocoela roeselum]|nr:Mechanosensitive ion channel protein 10 [Dictyocoela roeselum]